MKITLKKSNGFSLAEVIITLGIVGIVAAITLPAVIKNTNNQEMKTAFKKAFSDISNATNLIREANGNTLTGLNGCNFGDRNLRNTCLLNYYAKYLNISKICPSSGGGSLMTAGCWEGDYKYLGGAPVGYIKTYGAGAMTNNGYIFSLSYDSYNCTGVQGTAITNNCATMFIDVNGNKGPNQVGKDLYSANITADGLKPSGIPGDGYTNTCNPIFNGFGCAADALFK